MVKNYGLKPNGEIKPYWHSLVKMLVGVAFGVGCFFLSKYSKANIEENTFLSYLILAVRCLMVYIFVNSVFRGIEGLSDTRRNIKWTTPPTPEELEKLISESVVINPEKLLKNIKELGFIRFQIIVEDRVLYVGSQSMRKKYGDTSIDKSYYISLEQYPDYASFSADFRKIINDNPVRLAMIMGAKVSECQDIDTYLRRN